MVNEVREPKRTKAARATRRQKSHQLNAEEEQVLKEAPVYLTSGIGKLLSSLPEIAGRLEWIKPSDVRPVRVLHKLRILRVDPIVHTQRNAYGTEIH